MTPASLFQPRLRRLVAHGLLAFALVFLAAMPGRAEAADCSLQKLQDWIASPTMRQVADENFACLLDRIEALEKDRDALARRLARVPGGAAPAGGYDNVDGKALPGEPFHAPATFVLTGGRGGPRSLELDRRRLDEMCGDADGCLLSLGLKGLIFDGKPFEAMFSAGPCAFHLDPKQNAWALSGLCAPADLPNPSAAGTPASGGPTWGRAGDGRPFGGPASEGQVILSLGGACLIAEAQPQSRKPSGAKAHFERDTKPDLFLVTASPTWHPTGPFPSAVLPLRLGGPDFQCSLTIRD